jgi:hypothetical protein
MLLERKKKQLCRDFYNNFKALNNRKTVEVILFICTYIDLSLYFVLSD